MNPLIENVVSTKRISEIFWYFAISYAICYCLIPYFFSITIWPDSAQIYTWSQHFAWGYHEHPWFPPFIFNIFINGLNYSPISIFLIGALLNLMACWGVWRLGLKFLPAECALLAALLLPLYLLLCVFMGLVNNNTFNFGLWPWMFLFFYEAIKTQRGLYWIGVGIVAGLATLSKYYTIFPLACMFGFILFDSQARKSLSRKNFYLGLIVYFIVLLPHLFWLYHNDFASVKYALTRSQSSAGIAAHFLFPGVFFLEQIGNFILPFIFISILYFVYPRYKKPELTMTQFDQQFIHWMAWGPLFLTLLLATIFGWNLASEWGQALPCLWSLSLITILLPKLSKPQLQRCITIIFASIFLVMTSSLIFLQIKSQTKPDTAVNFPAQKIAEDVDNTWRTHSSLPLKYIITADEYVGGVVSFYSSNHPRVFSICPECQNDIKESDLLQNGAVLVLTNGYESDMDLPETSLQLIKKFPQLIILPSQKLTWKRSTQNNITVWFAILAPKKSMNALAPCTMTR